MKRKAMSCDNRDAVNRGAWSAEEDQILINYVQAHGEGNWRELSKRAGNNNILYYLVIPSLDNYLFCLFFPHFSLHDEFVLYVFLVNVGLKRRGKSCRLRWLNYLKPDIKRGNISSDEEDLIIRLHSLLGNRYVFIYYICNAGPFFVSFLGTGVVLTRYMLSCTFFVWGFFIVHIIVV